MDKKTIYYIVEWVVALTACAWLAWKMVTYDNYAALWETIWGMDGAHIFALLLCVALMPVNMSIEAWRWRTLMNGVQCKVFGVQMSWYEAHRQVYYSKLAGLITPWRLGEYPARALIMSEGMKELKNEGLWSKVLSMGAVGSATMTMAIVIGGLVSLGGIGDLYSLDQLGAGYWIIVGAVLVVAVVAIVFVKAFLGGGRFSRLSGERSGATVSHKLVLVSVGQSLVRLLCWCAQLVLVIWALGGLGELGILGGIGKSAIYYLLVTITPNVPVAEVGVRGAWAITVFGSMNAALAGVLLWVINTLLPCLIWPFLRKNLQ